MSQAAPDLICPICKDKVPKSEKFEDHVLQCAKGRYTCGTCDQSFKKVEYLARHVKTKHQGQEVSKRTNVKTTPRKRQMCSKCRKTVLSDEFEKHVEQCKVSAIAPVPTKAVKQQANTDKDCDSGWNKDPDIELMDDEMQRGRTVRKPTSPDPVKAPVKVHVQVEQPSNVTDDVESDDSLCSSSSSNSVKTEQQHSLDVRLSFQPKDETQLVRKLDIRHDEDSVLTSNQTVRKDSKFGNLRFNLSEFIAPSATLRPEDVVVQIEGHDVTLGVQYRGN